MAMKGDAKSLSFVEDTAVAPERLRDYIERFLAIVQRHGTTAGVYAHASVGCLHVRPVVNLKTEAGVGSSRRSPTTSPISCSSSAARSPASTATAWCAARSCEKMFGPALYEAFRDDQAHVRSGRPLQPRQDRRRAAADAPTCASAPATSRARRADVLRLLDARRHGGAVEMCSGLGACRKTLEGTMCPSFMATREEQHSTRGRANVLRLAMAGRLGEAGLGDDGVHDVLDLCLECRACKAECPVGVDVARFKSEFLADYWQRHGTPLHARALGNAHRAAAGAAASRRCRTGSTAAPARRLNERVLGHRPPTRACRRIAARRSLRSPRRPASRAHADVVLFTDTFTNHYDPEIGVAALDVLDAAGSVRRWRRTSAAAGR